MAQDGRNPDPVSPSSDVFSDDHAVEHPEQPLSSQSAISHHISEHALNPHTAPVRSRRSSPIRSSSRRSLASRLAYQNSDVQDASHHGPSLQGPDVSDNDAQHVSNDLNNHKDARPRRGGSNASSSFIPRSQSPYNGATGPSQPYGMYPKVPNLGHLALLQVLTQDSQEDQFRHPVGLRSHMGFTLRTQCRRMRRNLDTSKRYL